MKRALVVLGWMLCGCAEVPPAAPSTPPAPAPDATAPSTTAPSSSSSPPSASAMAAPVAPPASAPPASDPEPLVRPPTKKTYSLVVAFGSPGDGTDHEAAKRLEAIMKTQKVVTHERGRWGKEGEHDECFDLGAMPDAERDKLVARLKREVASSRTTVKTNAPCRNDR